MPPDTRTPDLLTARRPGGECEKVRTIVTAFRDALKPSRGTQAIPGRRFGEPCISRPNWGAHVGGTAQLVNKIAVDLQTFKMVPCNFGKILFLL